MKVELQDTELLTNTNEMTALEEKLRGLLEYVMSFKSGELKAASIKSMSTLTSVSPEILITCSSQGIKRLISLYTENLLLMFLAWVRVDIATEGKESNQISELYFKEVRALRNILATCLIQSNGDETIKEQLRLATIFQISEEESQNHKIYLMRILEEYYSRIGEILAKYDL